MNAPPESDLTANEREMLKDLAFNEYYHRRAILDKLSHQKRDLYADCGYAETSELTAAKYLDLYERFPIATRVIDLPVDEAWRKQPILFETEDDLSPTPFEEAWHGLDHTLGYAGGEGHKNWFVDDTGSVIWEFLKRVDRLSRIGHYGVLMMEFDDVDGETITWKDPAPGFELDSEYEKSPIHNEHDDLPEQEVTLLGLRCFDETTATITEWYEEGPLAGRPRMYNLKLKDSENVGSDATTTGYRETDIDVHWTRVIHVADGLMSSEFMGTPGLRPVANEIQDLRKIFGASGEGYWRMAFPWLSFESHPNVGAKSVIKADELREEVERAKNTLERYMATVGGTWKTIAGEVSDPTPHVDQRLEAICIYLGCPTRVFRGSERGELASSEDKDAWNERMIMRQQTHITPRIIVPFINRLITVGVLPIPEEGFQISWPDLTTLSLQSKATWAVTQVNAIIKYVSGGGDYLLAPEDFLVRVLGFSQTETADILENTKTHVSESAGKKDVIGRSPMVNPMDQADDVIEKREGNQKVTGVSDQKKSFGDQ